MNHPKKTLKGKIAQGQGGLSETSPLRSDGSRGSGGRLDHYNHDQRSSRGELVNNSRKPQDLTKTRHGDSLRRAAYSFSGKMKKMDDVADTE